MNGTVTLEQEGLIPDGSGVGGGPSCMCPKVSVSLFCSSFLSQSV